MSGPALLLEGALLVALDAAGTVAQQTVAVADGRIAAVDEAHALRARHPSAERVDCSDRILMPGFVNAHLHPEMHVARGLVEGLDLHGWAHAGRFDTALAILGSPDGRWIQRAAIRAALADCLLTGTTCVATYGVTVGADETAAAELAAFGMRGHVTIRDATFEPARDGAGHETVPALRLDPPRMYRLHAEEALTPAELVAASGAVARGERIVMHAAETAHRVALARRHFDRTPIRLLDEYGLLSSRTLLSHAVHVDDAERELLAERGACIVASPAAEMKLADGIAPIPEYVALGITVGIGTDSAICNDASDMFRECRQLGLVQRLRYGAHALPASDILRCATSSGATLLGEAGEYGSIEPGRSADLILIDTSNLRLQPLVHRPTFSNVLANLVFAATGQDVTDVMVRGEWKVRERCLLVADAAGIVEDLRHAARTLHDLLD